MVSLNEKKKYIKVAKEVIDLEIKALVKLKRSINESFNLAVQQILKCQSKIILCGVGKSGLIANKITKIYGIFNGTSNYILSSMDRENKVFNDVLSKAQKLGYAESNPTADLNGDDVSSKLKILSSLCFNSFLNNNIYSSLYIVVVQ